MTSYCLTFKKFKLYNINQKRDKQITLYDNQMHQNKQTKKRSALPIRFVQRQSQKYISQKKNQIDRTYQKNNKNTKAEIDGKGKYDRKNYGFQKQQQQQGHDQNMYSQYLESSKYRGNQQYIHENSDEYEQIQNQFQSSLKSTSNNNQTLNKNTMKYTGNAYDLTFKKQNLSHKNFWNQNNIKQHLKNQNEDEDENNQEIADNYSHMQNSKSYGNQENIFYNNVSDQIMMDDSSESYQQVRFDEAQKQQKERQQIIKTLMNPQSLLQMKQKLYVKYHSALINYHYFNSLKQKTIEQKHKQNLLQLLVNQLRKNIFINGLKINHCKAKSKKQKQNLLQLAKNAINQTQMQRQLYNGNLKNKYLDQQLSQEVKMKFLIFQQVVYGLVKRKMFFCFDLLRQSSKIVAGDYSRQNEQLNDQQNSNFDHLIDHSNSNLQNNDLSHDNFSKPISLKNKDSPYQKYNIGQVNQKSLKKHHQHKNLKVSQNQKPTTINNKQNHHIKKPLLQQNQQQSQLIQASSLYAEQQQDQNHNDQSQEQQQNDQQFLEDSQLEKMKQLIEYIARLKKQGRQVDSQLKRYFLKWKIFLLERILEDYQYQDQEYEREELQEEEGQQEQEQKHQYKQEKNSNIKGNDNKRSKQQQQQQSQYNQSKFTKKHKKFTYDKVEQDDDILNVYHSKNEPQNYGSFTSRQIQQNSQYLVQNNQTQKTSVDGSRVNRTQTQDAINQKTCILQQYLYDNCINQFWQQFSQNYTNQKLKQVSQRLRQQNLKKLALYGLRINVQWSQKQKQMDEYYQQIAQQQYEDANKTADLFYRTNLKTKYFFQFLRTTKYIKSFKILDSLTLKLSFLNIFYYADAKKKKIFNIQRYITIKQSKTLFKCFQTWKHTTILSPSFIKVKKYNQKRNQQILGHYFSILQIIYKKSLIKNKKAINLYKTKTTSKVFKYLQFLCQQSRQLKHKQKSLKQYLMFYKARQFIEKLQQNYGQQILDHRIKIKSQKLRINRQKQFMYQKIQEWRKFVIKKQSYRAIEYRLVKLKEKQIKQNMMSIWLNEFDRRVNSSKKDELDQSAQHKDWLVKYYGNLCEIATCGKNQNQY